MTSVSPQPDRVDHAVEAVGLDDSALFFNRELSWLDFNDRVLQLAEDPDLPLLERAKFCAIYTSNLDEFFMVRVAGLHDQLDAGIDARGPDGVSAGEAVDRIQQQVGELTLRQTSCFEEGIVPELAAHGITIASIDDVSEHERRELDARFRERMFSWEPYLYRELDTVAAEALERTLVEAGAINALGFRYVGVRADA
jgi:polyphosphate kinase